MKLIEHDISRRIADAHAKCDLVLRVKLFQFLKSKISTLELRRDDFL